MKRSLVSAPTKRLSAALAVVEQLTTDSAMHPRGLFVRSIGQVVDLHRWTIFAEAVGEHAVLRRWPAEVHSIVAACVDTANRFDMDGMFCSVLDRHLQVGEGDIAIDAEVVNEIRRSGQS